MRLLCIVCLIFCEANRDFIVVVFNILWLFLCFCWKPCALISRREISAPFSFCETQNFVPLLLMKFCFFFNFIFALFHFRSMFLWAVSYCFIAEQNTYIGVPVHCTIIYCDSARWLTTIIFFFKFLFQDQCNTYPASIISSYKRNVSLMPTKTFFHIFNQLKSLWSKPTENFLKRSLFCYLKFCVNVKLQLFV